MFHFSAPCCFELNLAKQLQQQLQCAILMQSENCFMCRELELVITVSHPPLRHKDDL